MPDDTTLTKRIGFLYFLGALLMLLPWNGLAQPVTAPVDIVIIFPGAEVGLALGNTSVSASSRISDLIFRDVAQPLVLSTTEKQEAAKQQQEDERLFRPRTLSASGFFRYERVRFDDTDILDLDGNIFTANLQMTWDISRFSLGVIVPFDYLDLESFDAQRTGAIAFGQYNLPVNAISAFRFTLNGQYTHTFVNEDTLADVNVGGGGVSVAFTADMDRVIIGGTMSYQYNAADTDLSTNHQHLLKVGTNTAVRFADPMVLNMFAIWTHDATNYSGLLEDLDDDYFDIGFDFSWSITPLWRFAAGYKKVLGLKDFGSDMVFLGTLLWF